MPRKVARYPGVGLLAFLITFAALSIQFGLFAVPLKVHNFTDTPDGTNTRAHRESEEDESRAARLVTGLAVLAVGSALGGRWLTSRCGTGLLIALLPLPLSFVASSASLCGWHRPSRVAPRRRIGNEQNRR